MRQLNWCLCAHAYMNELGKGPNYTMSLSHIHYLPQVGTGAYLSSSSVSVYWLWSSFASSRGLPSVGIRSPWGSLWGDGPGLGRVGVVGVGLATSAYVLAGLATSAYVLAGLAIGGVAAGVAVMLTCRGARAGVVGMPAG